MITVLPYLYLAVVKSPKNLKKKKLLITRDARKLNKVYGSQILSTDNIDTNTVSSYRKHNSWIIIKTKKYMRRNLITYLRT